MILVIALIEVIEMVIVQQMLEVLPSPRMFPPSLILEMVKLGTPNCPDENKCWNTGRSCFTHPDIYFPKFSTSILYRILWTYPPSFVPTGGHTEGNRQARE